MNLTLNPSSIDDYATFLHRKAQIGGRSGFTPVWMPDFLFPLQRALVEWAVLQGRAAIFADCGLGKSIQQLVWAENVVRHTNRPVLILTPLAVGPQTVKEAHKFGMEAVRSSGGSHSAAGIVVTNYEKLHHFDPADFAGVVCDESSILKNFAGKTRKQVTRFMSKMPYRLLCTATASPNDYVELGTSSDSLGELTHTDMLKRFFTYLDDKGQKRDLRRQEQAEVALATDPQYYRKLAFRVSQTIGQWRLKHHAIRPFWQWVCSWARACRKPSDLGYSDEGFVLPPLIENDHVIAPRDPNPEYLFNMPARGLHEEREERKRTITERCDYVAKLVDHNRAAVMWCHTNGEADRLVEVIDGAEQIAGATPDERKIELYEAFLSGQLLKLVIKPKIGAWGLNWQHCNHVVTFASHSYEQHYQSVRRCWRFGQMNPVQLDVIATEGESRVLENMRSKARKMDIMFAALVDEMQHANRIEREDLHTEKQEVPSWL